MRSAERRWRWEKGIENMGGGNLGKQCGRSGGGRGRRGWRFGRVRVPFSEERKREMRLVVSQDHD